MAVIMMVLINRAGRELSNGCHIVFWSNLDPNGDILDAEVDFKLLVSVFLDQFFTETILEFGSNQAHYTSNR